MEPVWRKDLKGLFGGEQWAANLAVEMLAIIRRDMFRDLSVIWLLGLASWVAAGASEPPSGTNTAALTLGPVVVDSAGIAKIDINLASADQAISALQFDIQYQGQILGISESLGAAAAAAGKNLWSSAPQNATTRIVIAGSDGTPISDGVIATLTVRVPAGASPAFYLVAANVVASDNMGYFVPVPAGNGGVTGTGPVVLAVANAASYAAGAIAPGEMVVIWGRLLGAGAISTLQVGSNGSITTSLAGTTVFFDGVPAPLVYTSEGQLGAIVPYGVDGSSQTSIQVSYQGVRSAPFVAAVAKYSPGIFTSNGSGQGQAAILNQDGGVNGPATPAARGSIVSVYGTGEGTTAPPCTDGGIVKTTDVHRPLLPVTGFIGEQSAEVIYAGSAPGHVCGFLQVNLRVPLSVAPGGGVPVRITIGSSSQAGVTMAVQ